MEKKFQMIIKKELHELDLEKKTIKNLVTKKKRELDEFEIDYFKEIAQYHK